MCICKHSCTIVYLHEDIPWNRYNARTYMWGNYLVHPLWVGWWLWLMTISSMIKDSDCICWLSDAIPRASGDNPNETQDSRQCPAAKSFIDHVLAWLVLLFSITFQPPTITYKERPPSMWKSICHLNFAMSTIAGSQSRLSWQSLGASVPCATPPYHCAGRRRTNTASPGLKSPPGRLDYPSIAQPSAEKWKLPGASFKGFSLLEVIYSVILPVGYHVASQLFWAS